MHDVGKIGTPDEILCKPGPLTVQERAEMERHTVVGHEILAGAESELLRLAATIALTHHERFDGSGYPTGLDGEEIPLEGRITAVADVFDALLSERSYRPALGVEEAVAVIRGGSGTQFDPRDRRRPARQPRRGARAARLSRTRQVPQANSLQAALAGPLGVPHPFQHRDLADLRRLQVVPEDAAGALVLALDLDHRARGGDQVAGKVVGGDHQVLAEDLDRVDGGGDRGVASRSCRRRRGSRTRGRGSRRLCRPGRR